MNGAAAASTAGIAVSVPARIEDRQPKRIVCADDADRAGIVPPVASGRRP